MPQLYRQALWTLRQEVTLKVMTSLQIMRRDPPSIWKLSLVSTQLGSGILGWHCIVSSQEYVAHPVLAHLLPHLSKQPLANQLLPESLGLNEMRQHRWSMPTTVKQQQPCVFPLLC